MTIEVRAGIVGDASSLSRAIQEVEQRQAQAAAFAEQLNEQNARVVTALLQEHAQLVAQIESGITGTQQAEAEKRLAQVNREIQSIIAAREKQEQESVALEKTLTQAMASENTTRVAQAESAASKLKGAASAFAMGAGLGVGAAGGAMLFMQVGQAARSAVTDFADFGHEVKNLSDIFGTSTENASRLLFQFQQFGLSGQQLSRTATVLIHDMQANEDEFNKLGIATRAANGNLLNGYATFQNLRSVLAGASSDTDKFATIMDTVSRSVQRGGGNIADLAAVLSLTAQQQAEMNALSDAYGTTLAPAQVQEADKMWHEFQILQAEQKGVAMGLSQELAPAVQFITTAFMYGIEIVKQWGGMLLDMVGAATSALRGDFPQAIHLAQQAVDDFSHFKSWDEIAAKVQHTIDVATNAAKIQDSLGRDIGAPVTGNTAGRDAAVQAIQDQIDALSELEKKREEEMRTALDAANEKSQAEITALQNTKDARDRAYEDAIARIRDEQQAADDALKAANDARQEQIQAIRDQVSAQEEALHQWDAEYKAAQDQKQLAQDSSAVITIRPNENIEDYFTRVAAQRKKVADDQHKVELDAREKSLDIFKQTADAQIRSIEQVSKQETAANEARKRASDEHIKNIETEKKTLDDATANAVKNLEAQIKERTKQTDQQIKDMQKGIEAEKKTLEDERKAIEGHAAAIGAAYKGAFDTMGAAAQGAQSKVDSLRASIQQLKDAAATANQGLGTGAQPEGTPTGLQLLGHPGGANLGDFVRFSETHAAGGSMMLTEPTALVGLSSRSIAAVAGAGEGVTISPRGGGGPGGGGASGRGLVVQVVLPNARVLAETVLPYVRAELETEAERLDAMGASFRWWL